MTLSIFRPSDDDGGDGTGGDGTGGDGTGDDGTGGDGTVLAGNKLMALSIFRPSVGTFENEKLHSGHWSMYAHTKSETKAEKKVQQYFFG
jgi:hypothetical protein